MIREEAIKHLEDMKKGLFLWDMTELIDLCISALSENKGEWIPISERLPEDGEWAIFTDGSTISVERYKADAIDHFYPQGRWFSFDKATAWLPLPEPYKAESEDEE